MKLSLALALLVCAGCRTAPCKDGTVLLRLDYAAGAVAADDVHITISGVGGGTSDDKPHVPGRAEDTIELDFPGGYPRGSTLTVDVSASAGGMVVGTGVGSTALGGSCEPLTITVAGSGSDAGVPDLAEADFSAQPDLAGADLAGADLAGPTQDLATPPDLTAPPQDLVQPPPDLLYDLAAADQSGGDMAKLCDVDAGPPPSCATDCICPLGVSCCKKLGSCLKVINPTACN
jgi:hypothetical protein